MIQKGQTVAIYQIFGKNNIAFILFAEIDQLNLKDCVEFILAEPNLLRYLIGFGIGFFTISGGLFLLSSFYMIIKWCMNDLNKIERKLKEKNNKQ
ncbi:hypothetical protein Mgra_00002300 [Meloidogyne graminicola]|uniref:Uncharacterized protein n=1 Tax=Meloidogyne graminicola TaxID=189291 RepID=A0A8S9ZYW8_9BILA|nr:hypothetical protein Mgra_00002300 [Meloidogyne graminicola]